MKWRLPRSSNPAIVISGSVSAPGDPSGRLKRLMVDKQPSYLLSDPVRERGARNQRKACEVYLEPLRAARRLETVGCHFHHCTVEHAVTEISEDHRRGFLEQDLFAPLLEARKEKPSSRGDGAEHTALVQQLNPALDEGSIDVVLGARIGLLELLLRRQARSSKRWVHQHHIKAGLHEINERDALRGITREQASPHTRPPSR